MNTDSVLVRRVHFSSGHSYRQATLSEQENKNIYGSWFKPSGLGHNFCLEAFVAGPVDPLTGMIVNLSDLDNWLKQTVAPLDHFYLNEVEDFKNLVPTAENIACVCFQRLQPQVHAAGAALVKVRLHEGENLWVDYSEPAPK